MKPYLNMFLLLSAVIYVIEAVLVTAGVWTPPASHVSASALLGAAGATWFAATVVDK